MTTQDSSHKAEARSRKPIFDLVRTFMGRSFSQTEVQALDSALDGEAKGAEQGERVSPMDSVPNVPKSSVSRARKSSKRARPRKAGPDGIALIKRFEGCARLRRDGMVEAYPDPGTGAEPWTIGWGATGKGLKKGERIGPGTVWTQKQCDKRFADDLKAYASGVAKAIGNAPTTQSQFDALVSFHYNTGAIARATLTRKHKAGDFEGAAAEFARWNKAGGRVLKGLVKRRREEAALYAKDQ